MIDFSSFSTMSIEQKIHHLINDRFFIIASPKIKVAYDLLKIHLYNNDEAELTMAWLALFSGDNLGLHQRYIAVNPDHLSSRSLGLYHDLTALSGTFGSIQERYQESLKALELLEGIEDLYLANAYITHGQVLSGMLKLRDAGTYFKKGYTIFFKENMVFAACVALTNSLFITYRLGELSDTIHEIEKALLIFSQFQSDDKAIIDVLELPLGMCYLEYGRYQMAEKALLTSQKAIDAFDLIHMHGYQEIALIKLYAITDQKDKLEALLKKMHVIFENMHYPMMQVIMFYAKYHLGTLKPSDLETLSFYQETKKVPHPLMEELILAISHDGKLTFPFDALLESIKQTRYSGDRIALIQQLLFLAEHYLDDGKKNDAMFLVEEIYQLYQHHHLGSALKLYTYRSAELLKKIDPKIDLKKIEIELFTAKEKEILVYIEKGLNNEEIANKLFISIGTVKWHINHIFSKLDVKHRAEAIKKAKDQGFL